MSNPMPSNKSITHVCVLCYTRKGKREPAKWVNVRGHALCHCCKDESTHHLTTGAR